MGVSNSRFASASAITKIAEILSAGALASFDFQNIPGTFRALELHWYGQSSAALGQVNLRINNDVAANYDAEHGQANAGAVAAQELLAQVIGRVGAVHSAQSGGGAILIPHYANALFPKICICITAYSSGVLTGTHWREMNYVHYRQAVAINRLALFCPGTWNAGSLATLYGRA